MQSLRPASLAAGGGVLSPRPAAGRPASSNLARPGPAPSTERRRDAAEILAEHNRNAERITEPRSAARYGHRRTNRSRLVPGAQRQARDGAAAQLQARCSPAARHDVADIGSNDNEYWFWIKDSPEKAVYYCNYDEAGASPLAAGLPARLDHRGDGAAGHPRGRGRRDQGHARQGAGHARPDRTGTRRRAARRSPRRPSSPRSTAPDPASTELYAGRPEDAARPRGGARGYKAYPVRVEVR